MPYLGGGGDAQGQEDIAPAGLEPCPDHVPAGPCVASLAARALHPALECGPVRGLVGMTAWASVRHGRVLLPGSY